MAKWFLDVAVDRSGGTNDGGRQCCRFTISLWCQSLKMCVFSFGVFNDVNVDEFDDNGGDEQITDINGHKKTSDGRSGL
ncbi:hypothetical protein BLOT_002883 [Blomia tropicalis]|nr:hypothetical protein BLOT_002883 [Blomia tropicalis]